MADRTTKVTLSAQISNYIAGMEKAAKATRDTATSAEKLTKQKEAFGSLGRSLLAVGAVAAVGVGLAIKKFAEFDEKMSQVKTLSHATAGEMGQLSTAALTLGQSIGFSASQVADAEIELVKAGVSVKDILGGALVGALNLAAAGQIDVGEATSIASSAMVQFGLKGKDVTHIADLLAAGADKALGGVSDLGTALKYAGPVAASLGVSLDETVGVLAEFAQNGILADQAGTSLRGMLSSLTSPSQVANDVLTKYKITLFDSAGRFIGLAAAAGQLHDKLGPLTQAERSYALGQIFGNQQITAANVLLKDGAAGVQKWTKAVNDQGFAAEQAAGKMDNLNGDLKKLGAAFESDLIQAGSAANGPLREMAKTVTGLLKLFGDLPEGVQQTALVIVAAGAAATLAGGAFLVALPKVVAFQGALAAVGQQGLATSLGRVTSFLAGPWGIALGVATIALGGAFLKAQADAAAKVDALTESLDKQTGALTKASRAATVKSLQDSGAFKSANKLGLNVEDVTSASLGDPAAIAKISQQLDILREKADKARKAFRGPANGFNLTDAGKTLNSINAITEAMGAQSDVTKKAIRDDIEAARASGDLTDARNNAADATAKASSALAENGKTLDAATDAGRANQVALDNVASAEQTVIDATQRSTQSQAAVTAAWHAQRSALYAVAGQFGLTGAAADNYVNQHLGKIPPVVNTNVNVNADAAIARIDQINFAYSQLQARANAGIDVIVRPGGPALANANGGMYSYSGVRAFANGGVAEGMYSGGTPLYKFAEKETRWEAFISGRPGAEAWNRKVWADAGRRLGMDPSGASGGAQFNITVQSKGGVDLLKYVDVRVDQIDQAKARKFGQG